MKCNTRLAVTAVAFLMGTPTLSQAQSPGLWLVAGVARLQRRHVRQR